jgi:hypothetical protein
VTTVNLLTFTEARESPCMTCESSPCCTHLSLDQISLDTMRRVDWALYLLNFEGIYLALTSDQVAARVFLHQPCQHLDPSGLCSVYRTAAYPSICAAYKSHGCGYRRSFLTADSEEAPLLDYTRMLWLAENMTYDQDRKVIAVPDWDQTLAAFKERPVHRVGASAPTEDPVREDWRQIVLGRKEAPQPQPQLWGDNAVNDPCQDCAAWCCQTLTFDRVRPSDTQSLDFFRFSLGFPSVELMISEEHWTVLVHTRCRHLEDGRCGVYGRPERPLRCTEYDEMACGYKKALGQPLPDDVVRVTLDQFYTVADSLVFDELGKVLAIPPVSVLSQRLAEAEVNALTGPRAQED